MSSDTGWVNKPVSPRHAERTLEANIQARRLEIQSDLILVRTLKYIHQETPVLDWLRKAEIEKI